MLALTLQIPGARANVAGAPFTHIALLVSIGLLAGLALVRLGQSAGALAEPRQLDYYEGVVYDNAARLLRGQPLYRPLDQPPYAVATYMPLYPALAATLRAVLGNGFGPGRALSVAAGLVTAGLIAYLAATRARDRRAGAFAALLFVALAFPGQHPWMSLYRVDMLGVACSVGAIAVLCGGTSYRRVVLASALAGLALLTKQLFLAAPLAGCIWLWRQDRRKATLLASVSLGPVAITALVLELATGAFIVNVVTSNVNPVDSDSFVANIVNLLAFQAGPLGLAILYLRRARERDRDLLVLFWLAAWLPLLGIVKVGAAHNYWLELAAITAVLATLALRSATQANRSRSAIAILILTVGLTVPAVVVPLAWAGTQTRIQTPEEQVAFTGLLERVRSERGAGLAEPFDVIVLAGRPVMLDVLIFSMLHREGWWDSSPLVESICSGAVTLLVLDLPLEEAQSRHHLGIEHWPRPVMAALRDTMRLEGIEADRYLYVPRQERPAADGCANG